jgi:predicted nucleotidyltransferase
MTPDPLAERIAERQRAASERAERLRARIPELARTLRKLGAKRVRVFGSLVSGAAPHPDTDIDLCVEGLGQAQVERAALELAPPGVRLDVVRWEAAPPELRAIIERYGVDCENARVAR